MKSRWPGVGDVFQAGRDIALPGDVSDAVVPLRLDDGRKECGAPVLASSAKVFASEAAVKAADWAMQITGQEGYLSGSRAERIFRDAKLLEILGDCTEKHRMFVADQVLAAY